MTEGEFKKLTVESLAGMLLEEEPTDEEHQAVEKFVEQISAEKLRKLLEEIAEDLRRMSRKYVDRVYHVERLRKLLKDQSEEKE